MNQLDLATLESMEAERDAFREGMLALLGDPDFRTEYECQHGTPLGRKCVKHCNLNPVRAAIKLMPR